MTAGPPSEPPEQRPVDLRLESRVAWDVGRLIADELRRRNVSFRVVTTSDLAAELNQQGYPATTFPRRSKRQRLSSLVQQHLVLLLFAGDFSTMWDRRRRTYGKPRIIRFADSFRSIVRLNYPFLNRVVDYLTGLVYGNRLDRVIVQITPSWHNESLTDRLSTVFAIVESWDHHCKMPTGYFPDHVVAWNHRLLDRWMAYQGAHIGSVGYPHKLAYTAEVPPEQENQEASRYIYAFTLSSEAPGFAEELELARRLAKAFDQNGAPLTLKLKPAEALEVQHAIATDMQLEVLGAGAGRGANYSLTSEYNHDRKKQLGAALGVITFGTTFALDVAASRLPLIQLDLRKLQLDYPLLASIASNEHLAELLYPEGSRVFRPERASDLDEIVGAIVGNSTDQPVEFSASTHGWLFPPWSSEDAISKLGWEIQQAASMRPGRGRCEH